MTQPQQSEVLQTLGLENLSEPQQEETLLAMGVLLSKATMVRIIEKMDESTRAAFDNLLESSPTEDQMLAFLEGVPGTAEAAQEAVAELQNDILAVPPKQ